MKLCIGCSLINYIPSRTESIQITSLFSSSHAGINCTQPAIDDFPKDVFTEAERLQGAFVLHIIASLYLFVALALVCDKYFVPAVEKICGGAY